MPFQPKASTVEIINELKSGRTCKDIGIQFNLTTQRINQIAKQYKIDTIKLRQELKFNKDVYKDVLKWGERNSSDLYKQQRVKFFRKKSNAIKNGYEWTIQFGQIYWPTHCPILNLELDYFAETTQENSVSFDRVNSNLGYVLDNVKIVSWRANRIKNNGTAEEHRKIADYLDTLDFIDSFDTLRLLQVK